ncbi:hypothetical protein LTR29_014385, partial [Friedmanniomyces endolithicus]
GMNTLPASHLWAPEQMDDHYAATKSAYFDTLLPIARGSAQAYRPDVLAGSTC